MADMDAKIFKATVANVDKELGIVCGWGIICKENGEDHFDLQGDNISEKVMLDAVTDFMMNSRVAKEMHTGDQIGTIVHSFPMTTDIAASLGIETTKTGWLVAMKPDSPETLQKFADRQLTGFSIGGTCTFIEEAA